MGLCSFPCLQNWDHQLLASLSEPALSKDGPNFGRHEKQLQIRQCHANIVSADTLAKQKAHLPSLRRGLSENPDAFKKTYKNAFLLARSPGAKVVQLDEAINFWGIILSTPSLNWSTDTTPWLEWWIEFLQSKWKKSVGKDMWDQTGVFVHKSLEDESMSWWSEEGSWPGVIDEFVAFVKAKRDERVKAKRDEGVKMDTE